MTNIQPPMEHFERPDPVLTNQIVTHLKSQGIFDQFRRECMADVDTKPAYHNLRQRVEGSVAAFLRMNPWRPDMNKNQLRDNLRKHIQSGGFLDIGVDRIVDQVVNPKIYTVFLPKVEEVVQSCLGMENDKPKFEPPPPTEGKLEPPKFQDKHNLAPRAKLPAPLMGPMLQPLKPPDQVEGRSSPVEEKLIDNGGDTDIEETGDKKYVVDEDDIEDKEEDDDDEESPPFEPHSEGDTLILGMRSDSSENSNDSQVVTTVVDDSLEERICNNETAIKEESDKKDEDSSSDEYVPKTPTINMEESDGTVLEFNSISEYKQYQTKFEEESFGNVEEVVASQCMNDNCEPVKEERSSNEEDTVSSPQKRKFNIDSYDDASSSSSDRESTSDEIKPAVFESFTKKRFKLEEYHHDNETSELSINDAENEDSYTEKSLDMTDSKLKVLDEQQEKHKDSSTSSKDSGKSYHIHHKEHRESSNSHSSKDRTAEKEHHEKTRSSHSSKDKKDFLKKSEKHESSRDQPKERDSKKYESSSKHNEKDGRSKHYDKEKERDQEKKRSKSSESSKKDKEDVSKNRKESKHEHKDHHHESKSRTDHDKEKKKHNRDKHSDGKEDHDSVHKNDKDRRDDSKHNHSSSRHSHRSSSEKHKSDKDHRHSGSSDRQKSHDKKLHKESKDESKKKYRQHCKYTLDKDENRRSSDRDSSGPSERTHMSDSSKPRSSRTHRESKVETGEQTTSNSDNTVSDNIEAQDQNDSKFDAINDHGIASPDFQLVEDSWNEADLMESDWNNSKEDQQTFKSENNTMNGINKVLGEKVKYDENLEDDKQIGDISSLQTQTAVSENHNDPETDDVVDSLETNAKDVKIYSEMKQDFIIPSISLHDSSSEKENIEQDSKEQTNSELDDNNTDASLDDDSAVVKFKKPKIAKNIHEVKKIMEARRHLKRMEKKRMKLLMKNNPEEYESDEKSPSENKSEEESQDDIFKGFEDDISLEKIQKYDCLTERLESEASQLEKLINYEEVNTNLITSWIDLDPNLDIYIENILKGKVHRSYRVHLPPICDEYYNYDSEQNVYFLVKNWDAIEQKDILVDGNLNNLNSVYSTNLQENMTSCNEKAKRRKLRDGPAPTNREIVHEARDYVKQNSLNNKVSYRNAHSDDEIIIIPEENIASSNAGARRVTSDVIASPKVTFSLTFNQTYDEVLKEKAQNSVVPSKRDVEEMNKTPLTVVKITNSKTSEQVFMKKFQSNSEDKVQVPRITKSESIVNGKIIENPSDPKQIPLISRITKAKNISTPSTIKIKHQQANGIVSPDSTTNFQEKFPTGVSQKIINDVIGIKHVSSDQGDISDQGNQSGEEVSNQRRRRTTGCRQQQRYDSSDLYKPRPQLSSRRVRAVGSSPGGMYYSRMSVTEESSVPQVVARRKRSATSDLNSSPSKRRR